MGKTEMSHARGWEGARGVRVRDGTRRAGRGCDGNVRRGLSGGGRGGWGGGVPLCAARGYPRANGANLDGGRASPDTVWSRARRARGRGSWAARTSRKNCLERAFASERLAEKTGAPAGALRPWLVANRASELLSAMTMAAAPLCPVAFLSPPQARFARVSNGRRLSLARHWTVADVPEMHGDEPARREWRPCAAGRAFSRDASGDDLDPRRRTSQRTGESRYLSRPAAVCVWRTDRSWLPRESTRDVLPLQRAREVRERSRVMSGWASSPPQVRMPSPTAFPSLPRRSPVPPSSRCFRLAASRFMDTPPTPLVEIPPQTALSPRSIPFTRVSGIRWRRVVAEQPRRLRRPRRPVHPRVRAQRHAEPLGPDEPSRRRRRRFPRRRFRRRRRVRLHGRRRRRFPASPSPKSLARVGLGAYARQVRSVPSSNYAKYVSSQSRLAPIL